MEMNEDIIIVGAGIGGLTTCLGLHRYNNSLISVVLTMIFLNGSSVHD